MENLKALTEAVCCVAREAGHFLKEERKSFRREVVQEKHASSKMPMQMAALPSPS